MFNGRNKRGDDIRDQVEEIIEGATDNLKEFGREARKGADDAKGDFVRQLNDTAKRIRKEARQQGVRGDNMRRVNDMAKGMENAAHYLYWNSFDDIGEDVGKAAETAVKNNPLQLLIIMLIVGVVIGLIVRGNPKKEVVVAPYTNRPSTM